MIKVFRPRIWCWFYLPAPDISHMRPLTSDITFFLNIFGKFCVIWTGHWRETGQAGEREGTLWYVFYQNPPITHYYTISMTYQFAFYNSRTMVVKRPHVVSPEDLSDYRNNPYGLSATNGLERPKWFQQRFMWLLTLTSFIFDNSFALLSVNFGTSHWNIPLPKTDTLIGFEADISHPSSECPASHK